MGGLLIIMGTLLVMDMVLDFWIWTFSMRITPFGIGIYRYTSLNAVYYTLYVQSTSNGSKGLKG
jgi:hypothetical protein